jgi:hypothetical protein
MIGYKAFYKSMKPGVLVADNRTEYIIGVTNSNESYNFCEMPLDLYRFYPPITYDTNVVRLYTIINVLGSIVHNLDSHESYTDEMQIIKVFTADEFLSVCIAELSQSKEHIFKTMCGDSHYLKNGLWHSDNDMPAIIRANGEMEWYAHGKLHRDNDKPAIITKNAKYWYCDGKLHRDSDKPAIIREINPGIFNESWYVNGKKHRDFDQPAIIRPGRDKYWFVNNKLHRESDDPSIILNNGSKFWHKNGILIKQHIVPSVCMCDSDQHNYFI